jgi:integrase
MLGGMYYLNEVKASKIKVYDLLAEFTSYLLNEVKLKNNQTRQIIKTTQKFLRFVGVKIDNEEFIEQVPRPKREQPDLEAVEKQDIIALLNACKNQRLKTALLMMASTGCLAIEACALRLCDVSYILKSFIIYRLPL